MLTDTQLYQVISVEDDRMTYKAKTATGRLHDQFTIDKPDGQAKIVTDDLANVKPQGVGGTVSGMLSLELAAGNGLGAFTPVWRRTTRPAPRRPSRARRATRRCASSTPPRPLRASWSTARSPSRSRSRPPSAAAFAPVGGARWRCTATAGPSKDPLTIRFKQSIGASEPLRTGAYAKSLTLTLSTTAP